MWVIFIGGLELVIVRSEHYIRTGLKNPKLVKAFATEGTEFTEESKSKT
jgi:hypothetical protein